MASFLPSNAFPASQNAPEQEPVKPRGLAVRGGAPRPALSTVGVNGKGLPLQKNNSDKQRPAVNSDKENLVAGSKKAAPFTIYCEDEQQNGLSQKSCDSVLNDSTSSEGSCSTTNLETRNPSTEKHDYTSILSALPSYPALGAHNHLDDVRRNGHTLFDESLLDKSSPMAIEESGDEEESLYDSALSSESDYYTAPPASEKELHDEQIYCVPEYVTDIYGYMRKREKALRPSVRYMPKQTDITRQMRSILVDWLVDVASEYELQQETLHLAVGYVDRVLSLMNCMRNKLQLVGTTAIMIAAKYEEIYPPEVNEFVYITDDTYSKAQVLKMERVMLETLKFHVAAPTAQYFATQFLKVCRVPSKTKYLTQYLCDLSLLEYDYLHYVGSQIAAASVCLASLMTGAIPWPLELEEASQLTLVEVYPCVNALLKSYRAAPESAYKSVFEKYREQKYAEVALMEAPEDLPEIS